MVKKVNANDVRTLIESGCKVVAVPYCTAQTTLTRYGERIGYHADAYGWRYDLIHIPGSDLYIVTGYDHPKAAGIIKPDRDTIQTVNVMDREYSYNDEDANDLIYAEIIDTLFNN